MRALVTGAAGFIGAHVVRALKSRGDEVIATARPGASWHRLAPDGLVIDEVDLGAPGAAAALIARRRPEVLVHLAWEASPDRYLVSAHNLDSLTATAGLFTNALDFGCRRLIGIGTCLEYAASQKSNGEGDPAGPDTVYAACKHAARLIAEQLCVAKEASIAWLRVFHLHGPGEDLRRVVPMVAARLRRGEPVDLSPGAQVRDYLRVEDVASAIAAVVHSNASGCINVCSGMPITLLDLLGTLGDVLGRRELLHFGAIPYREGERMTIAGTPGTLQASGWRPRYQTLAAGLEYLRDESL